MTTPASWRRRLPIWVALLVILAGLAARVAAATTNLWQDEVWSLWLLRDVRSPLDILTAVHHDNNHPVNSLFLYVLGRERSAFAYRLLSLASGAGAVALAGMIARGWGAVEGLTAMILFAVSYLMVLYSSEARGYMPAVFCGLLAFRIFQRHGRDPGNVRAALAFGAVVVLGFLSHLTFAIAYLGLVQWMLAQKPTARALLRWHGIPVAFLILLYLIDLRYMQYGGVQAPMTLARSLRELAVLPFGLPDTATGAAVGMVVLLAVVGAGVTIVRRAGDAAWSFHATCFAALLVVMVGVGCTLQIWFLRYGLVALAFVYLLFAMVLGRLVRTGPTGKAAYGFALLVFCAGNGWRCAELIGGGRGQYPQALADMARASGDPTVRIAGSDDTGIPLMMWFYGSRVSPKPFVYLPGAAGDAPAAAWFVVASGGARPRPEHSISVAGRRYALRQSYDCFTSCSRWYVYGLADTP